MINFFFYNMLKFNKMADKSSQMDTNYQELINSNIMFIEKQCFKIIRISLKNGMYINPVDIENEALYLFNRVIDVLSGNSYATLKNFGGKSKLTTYLSSIITRQAIDIIRRKKGRSRLKERAKKYAETGEIVLKRIIKDGDPVQEVMEEINQKSVREYSTEEILEIKNQILGKGNLAPSFDNDIVKQGVIQEAGNIIIPQYDNPENGIIKNSVNKKMKEIINKIFSRLDGIEIIILRMKYPVEDVKTGKSVKEIARILKMKEKTVYKRISRIFLKCRGIIQDEGVNINDIF